MYKVTINGVEQEGEFTPDECGEKTGVLLKLMSGVVTIQFAWVDHKKKKEAE